MARQKIPVYHLLHVVKEEKKNEQLQVEGPGSYPEKHCQQLHCYNRESQPASVSRQKELLFRGFKRLTDQHHKTIRLPKEYADLLDVTPNHLNALCQEMAGKTAGELIRDRVILGSRRLLVNAALSIAGIAYELNFQDNSNFSRFFRKQAGMTPEAFRTQYAH